MNLYFAPMEGITGCIYRSAHYRIFGAGYVDKYFAPFIFANEKGKLSKKDKSELSPSNNRGFALVPQLLTNRASDFIDTARKLEDMGYREINLNLGCPSSAVFSGGRGAGFLSDPDELERFLYSIFDALDGEISISIKTRIGVSDPSEFDRLLDIYRKFPLSELIVHPRVRDRFYDGIPDYGAYDKAVRLCRDGAVSLCYNGNIFSVRDFNDIREKFPDTDRFMAGRGMVSDPSLCREICGGKRVSKEELSDFYNEILSGYESVFYKRSVIAGLMKELLYYISFIFCPEDRKRAEELMRVKDCETFLAGARRLISECVVTDEGGFTTNCLQ